MTNWIPTNELRFVNSVEHIPIPEYRGWSKVVPAKVLQQKWVEIEYKLAPNHAAIATMVYRIPEATGKYEWRDVPVVEENT